MSKIYKIKEGESSFWDKVKYIGKINRKNQIDYINGENVFNDSIEYKFPKLYEKGFFYCDIDKFINVAKKFNIHTSFGGDILNFDLEIVFKNGTWIEIGEYDGQNWIELKTKPIRKEYKNN